MWSPKLSTMIIPMMCTIFLDGATQIFCVNTIKTLEHTFGFDFNPPPAVGVVKIWKISGNREPFTPLQYNGEVITFGSEETYLLLARRSSERFMVYYWLGKHSSLTDKTVAATLAVLLMSIVTSHDFIWIGIARETGGMESDSFQHSMKMFHRQSAPPNPDDMYAISLDNHLPSPRPNLYVVQGETYCRFKKVPLSLGLQWLMQNTACLVLEAGFEVREMLPINYLCGAEANENTSRRSWHFTDWFFHYFTNMEMNNRIENNKHSNDFKQFLELLENKNLYTPYEIDDSSDHLMNAVDFVISRDKKISLFHVTSDGLRENGKRPIRFSTFETNLAYLLDTKSVAGTFLVFPDPEDVSVRVHSIQLAEEYLEETYPSSLGHITKMRILERKPRNFIKDFTINLSDYPERTELPDDELW